MTPEENPADEISEEEYYRGMVEAQQLYQCPRCKGTPRPRGEWASRYGIMTCGPCLAQGYVILPETLTPR